MSLAYYLASVLLGLILMAGPAAVVIWLCERDRAARAREHQARMDEIRAPRKAEQ